MDAPWYMSNLTLHEDLHISTVEEDLQVKANKHHGTAETHPNPLLEQLLGPSINETFKKL